MVVLCAPAGMGKTSLLARAARKARQEGMLVCRARASELERSFAFGVVRQLLEREVTERPGQLLTGAAALAGPLFESSSALAVAPVAADGQFPMLHGLYWVVSNACERQPVMFVVDDAHLTDDASARFLAFLAARVGELNLAVVVAARPLDPDAGGGPLASLMTNSDTTLMDLKALSPTAVASLVDLSLGQVPDPEFARACFDSTGGNPFYLHELLREVEAAGVSPTSGYSSWVTQLGPAQIVRSLLARLAAMPAGALPLAAACAVLGDGARLVDCASVADLKPARAVAAADALELGSVFVPGTGLGFRHAILRSAVIAHLGRHELARLHARAATVLSAQGADVEQVAPHLLVSEPADDPRTVDTLRKAARIAMRRGDPGSANTLLRRAVQEPPVAAALPEVMYELGTAQTATGDPTGIDHLVQAVMTEADPIQSARRALTVGNLQMMDNRIDGALTTFSVGLNRLDGQDPELALSLKTSRFWAARQHLKTIDAVSDQQTLLRQSATGPDGAAHRAVLATLAREAANLEDLQHTNALLDRALAEPGLGAFLSTDSLHYGAVLLCLCCVDRFGEFDSLVEEALTDAGRNGSVLAYFVLTTYRSWSLLRRGRLVEAEQSARAALALDLGGWNFGSPALLGVLLGSLLDQGRFADARTAMRDWGVDCESPSTYPVCMVLDCRGRLRVAEGDLRGGLADLLLAGQQLEALKVHSPAMLPWRSHAAAAHLKLGDRSAAVALAEDELRLAHRLAGPSAVGASLRTLGLATGGPEGVSTLEQAVRTLNAGAARLQEAHALVDLGAALRRQGHLRRAQIHLREGLDQATRCQASDLVERAHHELLATGSRPRRTALHGPDALTASEARIARIAAQGLTNTEIAQSLFISRKTVEKHLANTYRKLRITSRSQLDPTALTAAYAIAADPPLPSPGTLPVDLPQEKPTTGSTTAATPIGPTG